MKAPARKTAGSAGFTLIEVLIVVVTMGAIVISLSLIVTTVLRTSPSAEARDDDSRTLLGLTTYLPEDVNSTPPGGFDFGKATPTGCAGASPGISLVRLTWTETKSSVATFRASYRYVDDGSGYEVWRYTCRDGQTPSINSMTSKLPSINEATWLPGDAPVAITPYLTGGENKGLSLEVTTIAGDTLGLEMRTNNPDDTLPPVPPGFYPQIPPGNQAPVAADVNTTIIDHVPLDIGLPASDPDGDGLTVSVASFPPMWSMSIVGLTLDDVTTPALGALAPGTIVTFQYTVADPYGQTATGNITLTVGAASANNAPTATDVTTTAVAGSPLIIDLPVSDIDGDPLTVTWGSTHPSLTVVATGPTQLTVTSDGTHSHPGPFNYTVDDGTDTATAQIRITVTSCNVTSLTPASTNVERKNNGRLKNSVTFNVTYTGPCTDLVLEYDNDLSDGYQPVYLSFGSGTSVTVQGHPGGLNWTLGTHVMTLKDGQTGPALLTSQLAVT